MKKLLYILIGTIFTMPTYAAPNDTHARVSMQSRAMVGTAQSARKSSLKFDTVRPVGTDATATTNDVEPTPAPDTCDAERIACMSNNIGVGNTFVWASKYSNTNDYASLIEDVDNPENNVCFVRVEMRSGDSAIDLSYVKARYFQMGDKIMCGAWTDKSLLEKNILDAKKSARTWATVGGAVGGAGIGVGAMELFGNKALSNINGLEGLEGQKKLSRDDLLLSELREWGKDNVQYKNIVNVMKALRLLCGDEKGNTCNVDGAYVDFNYILGALGE